MAKSLRHHTKMRARRVPLDRGGYTRSGRYYGTGAPLYEVYEPSNPDDYGTIVRAASNKEAVRQVRLDTLKTRRGMRWSRSSERLFRFLGPDGRERFWRAVHGAEKRKKGYATLSKYEREAILRKMVSRKRRKTQTRRRR